MFGRKSHHHAGPPPIRGRQAFHEKAKLESDQEARGKRGSQENLLLKNYPCGSESFRLIRGKGEKVTLSTKGRKQERLLGKEKRGASLY